MEFPTFDELLDRVFYADSEVFAHDTLFVFISHKTNERFVFHNASVDDYQQFIEKYNPILVTYNGKSYDKILLEYLEQENNEKFFSEIKSTNSSSCISCSSFILKQAVVTGKVIGVLSISLFIIFKYKFCIFLINSLSGELPSGNI